MNYLTLFIFITFGKFGSTARILGIVSVPSYSHQIVFQPIWKELASRGHDLVILTTNPINDSRINNLREIDWGETYSFAAKQNLTDAFNGKYGILKTLHMIMEAKYRAAEFQLDHPEVQKLIHNTTEHFDLVMVENNIPTMYAFGYRFKCPMIGILSFGLDYNAYMGIGNPFHPVTKPLHFLPFYSNLNFFERVVSTLFVMTYGLFLKYSYRTVDVSIKKYFGEEYPPISELSKSFDMMFANINPVLKVPNPNVPALIEFGGGIHIQSPKPLPKSLKNFLDKSKNGIIFFSLGTNVKSKLIPNETKEIILKTFSDLPYDILWKFEDTNLINLPGNVKILPWVPQMDVLRHPNVKVFISQCGLQSIEEALYSNVPLIGMPFFGDQLYNARMIEDIGIGLSVNKNNINKEIFTNVINTVINDPSYKKKISKLAKLSRDVPMTGMQKVVFWTEYVLRNKGAKHLKSPLVDLPFYQYYLLDVFGFVVAIVFIILCVVAYLIKYFKHKFTNKDKTE